MVKALQNIPLFRGFDDQQIEQLSQLGQELEIGAGELILEEGKDSRGLFVVLAGELEVSKEIAGRSAFLGTINAGSFVGEISLLTRLPHSATVRAAVDSHLLYFPKQLFEESLDASPIIRIILETMSERLRATEATVQQHEKLSALGKLSAGLAHELNNPAAASLRAVQQLPEALLRLQALVFQLNEMGLSRDDIAYLTQLQERLVERAGQPQTMDPLAVSDLEETVADWIKEAGIKDGWRLAPALISAGMDVAQLETLRERLGSGRLPQALTWLEGMLSVRALLRTIEHSSSHIYELVSAVKDYSYMDRSPVQDVDVQEGLESTLTIMGYKLREVTVTRDYAGDLPRITAHGSRLNQVWTNLIDNAVDAMEGKGQLTVRTQAEDGWVVVEILDDGPGIPPEIQPRIYEPFFTTKDVGRGTGLGLDIVYRIVTQEHKGRIRLDSEPGNTRFQIYLPTM